MTQVEFKYNGRVIKGILLGKYQCPHEEVYTYQKRFFWKTKLIYKSRTLHTTVYVIFIPWKHREKELVEIDEKYIIHPESIQPEPSWIKIDRFISKVDDGYVNPLEMKVNHFVGYPFLYENNSFLGSLALCDTRGILTVMYQIMPEILEIDLNNAEE